MGSWGSCDFSQLRQLQRQIEALQKDQDRFCEECAKYLAQRLIAKVRQRTPVDSGNLRRNWTTNIHKEGQNYVIELINQTEYASYVEYGHRQEPGRFVPAIGRRLKKAWVPGQFMLTISERELQEQAPAMLEQRLTELLRRALNAE